MENLCYFLTLHNMDENSRKNLAICIAIAGLLLFQFGQAWGEEISLSARLDKTEIPFESTVELSLEVRWQGGIEKYAFEILPLPTAHGLRPLGTTSSISSRKENGVDYTTRTFKYTLKPVTGGTGVIEPIVLRYVAMPDSIPGQLTSQQFQIAIAQPLPPEKKSHLPIVVALSAIILFLSVCAIYFLSLRRKKRIPREPIRTAEQIFLDDLSLAKKESQSERKLFFTRLYKLLIGFMEKKYGISGAGRATSDILSEMEKAEIPLESKEQLSIWLTLADKEKYAPSGGTPGDIIRLITDLEIFFNRN